MAGSRRSRVGTPLLTIISVARSASTLRKYRPRLFRTFSSSVTPGNSAKWRHSPGQHVEAETSLDGQAHLWQNQDLSIVLREKCPQDCQGGLIDCCSGLCHLYERQLEPADVLVLILTPAGTQLTMPLSAKAVACRSQMDGVSW
jgi:hypothetical protein